MGTRLGRRRLQAPTSRAAWRLEQSLSAVTKRQKTAKTGSEAGCLNRQAKLATSPRTHSFGKERVDRTRVNGGNRA